MSASINQGQTTEELRSDNVALRERVLMAEGTLDAIRRGEVDALVSQTPQGPRVFTLVDACSPYRTFVEEMQHGAATLSAEGTVLYCNRSLPVLLHAPAERIVGAAWQSLVAPESAADSARLLTWAARANSNAELTLRAADGQFVPVGVSAHPLTVDDVQTTCLVITDLSERKRAEEETRKLAALVKYTEDTFFCAGSANVERNNAFSRSAVASYAVAVLLVAVAFLSRWILWPVLGSESPFVLHWPALVFAAWYGGFRAGVLATVLSACGTAYFLMEPRFSLTVANAGARLGLCLFFGMGLALSLFVEKARQLKRAYLISDTQAQANLATSAYYRSLIEANLDPMVIKDKAGKITDLNRAAETATGRTRAELIGVEFTACFTDPDQARQLYQEAQQQGWVRDQPLEIRHRDGHTIPVLYNAALYRDLAGNVAGLVATLRDISERLKMDKELRRIEWLLGGAADSPAGRHTVDQPYGDLVQLNTSRLLADGAGATTLTDLTEARTHFVRDRGASRVSQAVRRRR